MNAQPTLRLVRRCLETGTGPGRLPGWVAARLSPDASDQAISGAAELLARIIASPIEPFAPNSHSSDTNFAGQIHMMISVTDAPETITDMPLRALTEDNPFDVFPDPVWVLDRRGQMVRINSAAERMFGIANAQVGAYAVSFFLAQGSQSVRAFEAALEATACTGSWTGEVDAVTAQGDVRHFQVRMGRSDEQIVAYLVDTSVATARLRTAQRMLRWSVSRSWMNAVREEIDASPSTLFVRRAMAYPAPLTESGTRNPILVQSVKPIIRQVVCEFLHAQGYETLASVDASDAMAIALRFSDSLWAAVVANEPGMEELGNNLRLIQPHLEVVQLNAHTDPDGLLEQVKGAVNRSYRAGPDSDS